MLWNELTPPRFPDVIVRATSEEDTRDAIGLARSRDLRVALRASGHSWCGSPLRDGGMLIDLSRLRRHTVDRHSAVVQPGVTSRDLAHALAGHDRAFPVAHSGSVALSGFVLSGGLGWNSRAWGPACHSLRSIQAVTAAGELVRCSEDENADLFWAARGAGPGFFAAVTSFGLSLHRLPPATMTTRYVFPLADLEDIAYWTDEVAAAVPSNVELSVVLTTADHPVRPGSPPPKVVVVTATVFASSWDDATLSLEPLRDCPLAGRSLIRQADQPTSYDVLFAGSDALWPRRHRAAADSLWLNEDFGTLLPGMGRYIAGAPSDESLVLAVLSPGGPATVPPPEDMAFAPLGGIYLGCYAIWRDQTLDEANLRWLRETIGAAEPLGAGYYVGETDLLAAPSRARRSFTPAAWERLQALRAEHDPDGVFEPYPHP
jgi:FAD/FMN-containing dehydrogenase